MFFNYAQAICFEIVESKVRFGIARETAFLEGLAHLAGPMGERVLSLTKVASSFTYFI